MKRRYTILAAILMTPVIALVLYIAFLWITYIDDEIFIGEKYGFTIGTSKDETFQDVLSQQTSFPDLYIYITYGGRAGDYFEVSPREITFQEIKEHDRWELQFDGEGEYFNVLRLKFDNEKLSSIYRHRKYFELP